jgi:hypothetical protein
LPKAVIVSVNLALDVQWESFEILQKNGHVSHPLLNDGFQNTIPCLVVALS